MANIRDFVVKQGLIAEGTVQATSTITGALRIAGGGGIGGNIFIGGSIKRASDITGIDHQLGAQLSLRDGIFTDSLIAGRTAWGITNYFGSSVLDTISENATYTNAASVYIKGAPAAGTNLTIEKAWSLYITSGTMYIGESAGSTTTSVGQALQIAGGISIGNGIYASHGGSLYGPFTLNNSEIITRANMNIGLAEFPDGIRITTSTNSYSTVTGALVVDNNGGVGIGGNLYLGGYFAGLTTGTFLSTLNSVSTSTGAFTVKGGVGVGGDLYAENGFFVSGVSSTSTVGGNSLQVTNNGGIGVSGTARIEGQVWIADTSNSSGPGTGALVVQGGATVERNLTANTANILDDTAATTTASAAFTVVGGVGIGKNLIIGAAGSSTGTTATNALVVQGGGYFGGSLTVDGSTVIKGDLFLLGTGTQVTINSTNTYIVDPVIEIGGGIDGSMLTIPDVHDKGLLIHYQNAVSTVTDYRAFFGLENTTERFIFKTDITPGVSGSDPFGNFYTSGTWSTLEAGSLILRDNTLSTDQVTGALIVTGGIGIGGDSTFASTTTFISEQFSLTAITDNAIQVPDGGIGSKYLYISEVGYIGNARILTTGTVNENIGGIFTNTFQFVNITESNSTDSGAVTVTGGVGIGGNLYVGGDEVLTGSLRILDDTQSIGTDSGAVTVVGGVGIGKNINVGGSARINDTTQSTSTDTGALVVGGGVGVAGDLTVGGLVSVVNTLTVEELRVLSLKDSTAIDNGAVVISGGLGVGKSIFATNVSAAIAEITSGSNAISTTTGDLVVVGGVGIGQDTYIGGLLRVNSTETSTTTDTGALAVAGGLGISKDVNIGGTITRSGTVSKNYWNSAGAGLVLSSSTYIDQVTSGFPDVIAIHSIGRPTVQGVLNPTWKDAATVYIDDKPQFTGGAEATNKWALLVRDGSVKIASTATNNGGTTNTGALQVVGGLGVGGNATVGGELKANTIKVADNKISSAVVTGKNTDSTVTIDTFVGNDYTTAKYLVQVVDLGTPNKLHVVELLVAYDGTNDDTGVFISQYGIITSVPGAELGAFDVTYNGGNINVTFTPNYIPVNMSIRAIRLAIVT
jgi:hypothetical protein